MPHENHIELDGEALGEAGHRPGRLIAIATVVTTLAAAMVGYMQASAIRTHDEADARAERLGALALNVAAANEDQVLVQVDRYRIVREDELQAQKAETAFRRTGNPSFEEESANWSTEASLTEQDSKTIARGQQIEVSCSDTTGTCKNRGLPVICTPGRGCNAGAWYSPARDPLFPTRYEQAARWESYRLSAAREAADREADAAETRFSHLAAALTMLAVAVFLFGYSLTPQGRERRALFLKCAGLFLLLGCGWAAMHGFESFQGPKPGEATAFANGEVAYQDGDYRSAISELVRATKLWPGDANAYEDLALAQYNVSIPRTDPSGTLSVPTVATLKTTVADDRKAMADGSESPTITADLGADLLFLGVLTDDNGLLMQAREYAREAARALTNQLTEQGHPGAYLVAAQYTIAEADLALGNQLARPEYCAAIRDMFDLRQEVSPSLIDQAAHTDVSLILRQRPGRKAAADVVLQEVDTAARTGTTAGCASSGGYEASAAGSS